MNEYCPISAESQHNFHFLPHFNSKTTEPIVTFLQGLRKVKKRIAVSATSTAQLRELTCHMDHTVLPATWQRWHTRLYPSQLRLVLNLATPEGCKAELT